MAFQQLQWRQLTTDPVTAFARLVPTWEATAEADGFALVTAQAVSLNPEADPYDGVLRLKNVTQKTSTYLIFIEGAQTRNMPELECSTGDLLILEAAVVEWGSHLFVQRVSGSVSSTSTAPGVGLAPTNVTLPVLSGIPLVGEDLSCSPGTWSGPAITFAYQWTRDGSDISGATSATYTLVEADDGTDVLCRVTASNAYGEASETSNFVSVTTDGPDPTGNDGTEVTFRSLAYPPLDAEDGTFLGILWPTTSSTPTPGPGGVYRDFASVAAFDAAKVLAQPGDVLRQTADITGRLEYRGNAFGIGGSAGAGAAGNHITIYGNGFEVNRNDQSSNDGGLDVLGAQHVDVVGMTVRNGQFGIRLYAVQGSGTSPCRVAFNTVHDSGHSNIKLQGWHSPVSDPSWGGWGYSRYTIVEHNTSYRAGRTATQFGECLYLGAGSPGWVSPARDAIVRHNNLYEFTADGLDLKPGCHNIRIVDNAIHNGGAHFGAALGLCYVDASLASRPSWFQQDPQIFVEGNRVWDLNLSNPVASSAPWLCYLGLSGIRLVRNMFWSNPSGYSSVRARIEKTAADFRTDTTYVAYNLFWSSIGFERSGTGAPGSANPSGLNSIPITTRGNIGPTGATGVQHNVATSKFRQPGAIPAVGSAGNAVWTATEGHGFNGSAFDWDPTQSPVDDPAGGTDDLVLMFRLSDITRRLHVDSTKRIGPFNTVP